MKSRLQNKIPNENAHLFIIITLLQRVQKMSYFENNSRPTLIVLQIFPFHTIVCIYINFNIYFHLYISIHIDTNIISLT